MQGFDLTAWNRLEYIRLVFHLEFQDDFTLTLPVLLQLRRELVKISQHLREVTSDDFAQRLDQLLIPQVPSDPVIRRYLAKTPPPFILQLPDPVTIELEAGDVLKLPILFWGEGRQLAPVFAMLLQALGSVGLSCGRGEFAMIKVTSCNLDDDETLVWGENERDWDEPEWSLLSVESLPGHPFDREVQLKFLAPARVMKKGRPLFRPSFAELFPYILRRVTGMCSAWSGAEVLGDPKLFLEQLSVCHQDQRLYWEDWRELHGETLIQPLGGIVGSLRIPPECLEVVGPVLQVGQLLNLGQGAAFGGGAWQLL